MHELAPLIMDLAIILGVGGIAALLCQKIRQPVILGYLLAGVIVGPYTPPYGFLNDMPNVKILSELGVIFLMFSLGLEFSFHKLKRVGFSAGATGLVEVLFMLAVGFATGKLLGWPFYDSLFLGSALAMSSTTIIIKALEELKLKNKKFAEIVFGVLIVEDLLAILLLVGLSTLVATSNFLSWGMFWSIIQLILVVGGWFLIGYFLIPPLFRRIMPYVNAETLIVVSVSLCLFLVCVAARFHYSTALGAFIMGSILAETTLVSRIEHLLQPIRDIFAAVFFVSIGMLIDPSIILTHLPAVALLCLVTIIGKLLLTGFGAFSTGQTLNNSLRIGFSMAQIGEFSFIIIALGASLNVISDFLYPVIVSVSAITTLTTPYLIKISGYLAKQLDLKLPTKTKHFIESYTLWLYRSMASSKQQLLFRQAATRFIVSALIVGIIFNCSQHWLLPKIDDYFKRLWVAKSCTWLLAILFSSPFIWGMLTTFKNAAEDPQKNHKPALFISWLITITIVTLLSVAYFDTKLVFIIFFAIALTFFIILYKQIDKSYHWFSMHLAKNLTKKNSAENLYKELAPWDMHLIEIEVYRKSLLANKTLNQYQLRQKYGINVIAISRGIESIMSPRGNQIILPFDKLILLGTDEQLEKFNEKFISESTLEAEAIDILSNIQIKTLLIDSANFLIGKSISQSNIRENIKGLVLGIERKQTRILNPDSKIIIEEGDLLFIVGANTKLENLPTIAP